MLDRRAFRDDNPCGGRKTGGRRYNGNGDGEKNEVATIAKNWWCAPRGLGAQAGMPVLLEGNSERNEVAMER